MQACMYAGGEKLDNGKLKAGRNFTGRVGNRSIFTVKQDVRLLNEAVVLPDNRQVARKADGDKPSCGRGHRLVPAAHVFRIFRKPMADCMAAVGFPIPEENGSLNLRTKGNTGSASIYIMVDELLPSGRLKHGDRLLCFIPESGRFTGSLMHLTVVDHAG
jgi:3-oxoacyl-[acyl-carrier-protein] synthase-3